ncbi:receptor expression-enhancing protein 3 [Mus pahari]|uniref:receptor expression-enhancing protein 3 n=1 Tax=Mus pahari TaxID=10093 RepID=UPI001114B4F5|nr:receptor expression-enhancing protein 3 [Mus pahari]
MREAKLYLGGCVARQDRQELADTDGKGVPGGPEQPRRPCKPITPNVTPDALSLGPCIAPRASRCQPGPVVGPGCRAWVSTGAAPSQTLHNPGFPRPPPRLPRALTARPESPGPGKRGDRAGRWSAAPAGVPEPPPISGAQGRGRQGRRGRGRGRTGGGPGSGRLRAPRAHTGPAPEGASAAPGSASGERAACGQRPSGRKDGVLDDLPSRGVRWMMYWIVFALYTVMETVADQTLAWFPLYYELKIAFVIWLLSPYTRGASLIYRKFLHPLLSSKEREIDDYIVQAKEKGYETMVNFGRQSLNLAAAAAVTAAVKSQGAITERLRSFSMHDLTSIQGDEPVGHRPYQTLPEAKRKGKQAAESPAYGIPLKDGSEQTDEEAEGPFSDDEMVTHKALRRSQSMKSVKTIKGRKEVRYGSLKYKVKKRPQVYF